MEKNEQNDPSFKAKIFLSEAIEFMSTLDRFGVLGEVLEENQVRELDFAQLKGVSKQSSSAQKAQ